ncbi:MAG: cytochrome c biogenesis protein CcsA [Tepidisphaerales bacterium]
MSGRLAVRGGRGATGRKREPEMLNWLDRLFVFAASLKLAVGVILALAAFLAVATVYEAKYGMEPAASQMYGSTLFLGLMAVLAVNVLAAALIRYPWTRRQTGFVITHAGILVLLLGCLVSYRTAVDARIRLRPGDSATDAAMLQELVQVTVGGRTYRLPGQYWSAAGYPSAWRALWPAGWPEPAWREGAAAGGDGRGPRFELAEGVEAQVTAWLPAAKPSPDGSGFVPADVEPSKLQRSERAMRLALTVDGVRRELWLRRGELPTGVDTPRGAAVLAYGYRAHDLPFSVTLVDAWREDYPGTDRPAAFTAELTLRHADGASDHRTLTLNRPAMVGSWWSGHTLYLGQFETPADGGAMATAAAGGGATVSGGGGGDGGGGRRTRGGVELLVRYDPGTLLKYGGAGLIALGVFLMFYMRAYFVRPRRAGADAPTVADGDSVHGGGGMPGAGVRHGGRSRAGAAAVGAVAAWLAAAWAVSVPGGAVSAAPPGAGPATELGELRAMAVLDGGRVKPLDTLARETVRAVTGRERLDGMDPLELFLAWQVEPEVWERRAVLAAGGPALREALEAAGADAGGGVGGRVSPAVVRRSAAVAAWAAEAAEARRRASAHGERVVLTREQAAAEALMARLARFDAVVSGAAVVPADVTDAWTARRLRWEVAYYAVQPFRWALGVYLASVGALALSRVVWVRGLYALGVGLLGLGVVASAGAFVWRCVVTGWAPVTNLYETVVWVALVSAGVALAMELWSWRRRARGAAEGGAVRGGAYYPALAGAVAAALASVVAAVMPPEMGSAVATLAPVLQSNLYLTLHVLTIVSAYAAFAVALVLGNVLLVKWAWGGRGRGPGRGTGGEGGTERAVVGQLYRAVQLGVLLMLVGTVLGGVWADVSWGRFWGWDPKEVWALVVLLTYLALLHARYAGWVGPRGLALGSVLGFVTVVMSWYGVNFLLGAGLHTYGFGEGGQVYVLSAVAVQLAVAGVCWVRTGRGAVGEEVAGFKTAGTGRQGSTPCGTTRVAGLEAPGVGPGGGV